MKDFKIRRYSPADKAVVMTLMEKHIPFFFAPEELNDYSVYLDEKVEDYFVVERSGQIIACGGINYEIVKSRAKISWDIVDPNYQGEGWGKLLLEYRIGFIQEQAKNWKITVRTSQFAFHFYQKSGFVLQAVEKDFWAKGFDLYEMEFRP